MMITKSINNEKSVIFNAPAEDIEAFDEVAWSLKVSRSELLRQCIKDKINEVSA